MFNFIESGDNVIFAIYKSYSYATGESKRNAFGWTMPVYENASDLVDLIKVESVEDVCKHVAKLQHEADENGEVCRFDYEGRSVSSIKF